MTTEVKPRRLKAIAAWINEFCPELRAVIERGYCNTDRKIGRLRWPGKGRHGNRIKVFRRSDSYVGLMGPTPLIDHNSAQTYRRNEEVERWLWTYLNDCLKGKHHRFFPSSIQCQTCGKKLRPLKERKES